jgi:hypothetical protein
MPNSKDPLETNIWLVVLKISTFADKLAARGCKCWDQTTSFPATLEMRQQCRNCNPMAFSSATLMLSNSCRLTAAPISGDSPAEAFLFEQTKKLKRRAK